MITNRPKEVLFEDMAPAVSKQADVPELSLSLCLQLCGTKEGDSASADVRGHSSIGVAGARTAATS